MNGARQAMSSNYMNWAKECSHARFNLATSGLENLKLQELQVSLEDLELTGEGGYGYQPLIRALAERYQVGPGSVVTTE